MYSRRIILRSFLGVMRVGLLAASLGSVAASAADTAPGSTHSIDPEAFFAAIVTVQARALPDARSAATLGTEREGTGIVIGKGGLILTIGYLIVEADDVRIVDDQGHVRPARVVGYDHNSGFGLVQPIAPFDVAPLKLGDSSKLAERDPVLIVNHSGRDEATRAVVVSRRPFTGSWEYLLDAAIFTSPPALNWSGAALIGTDGSLLGVRGQSSAAGQYVRTNRRAEADPFRSHQDGAARRARAAMARPVGGRGPGEAGRQSRVTGRAGRSRGGSGRRHHSRRGRRRSAFASGALSEDLGTRRGRQRHPVAHIARNRCPRNQRSLDRPHGLFSPETDLLTQCLDHRLEHSRDRDVAAAAATIAIAKRSGIQGFLACDWALR
jgi:hypothetical protein